MQVYHRRLAVTSIYNDIISTTGFVDSDYIADRFIPAMFGFVRSIHYHYDNNIEHNIRFVIMHACMVSIAIL